MSTPRDPQTETAVPLERQDIENWAKNLLRKAAIASSARESTVSVGTAGAKLFATTILRWLGGH